MPNMFRIALSFVFAFGFFTPSAATASAFSQDAPSAPQAELGGVTDLALGSQHTCAVVNRGVKCWGNNQYGQVGDGTTQNRNVPVDVVGLGAGSGVTHIWAGEYFTCAIIDKNNDGLSSVKCWGRNDSGQLGDGTFITRSVPAFVVGSEGESWEIGSYSGVGSHSCIKLGSPDMTITVLCWGLNATYQLGDGTSVSPNHPVTATNLLTMAEPNAFKIATGGAFSCAQLNRSFSDIRCLGANGAGQLGNGTTIPSISGTWVVLPYPDSDDRLMDFAANGSHACFVDASSGSQPSGIFCWGFNAYGQVGINTTQNVLTPTRVVLPGYIVGTNLATGEFHTCNYNPVSWYDPHFPPFASDSHLTCWGRNDYGQLGDGTTTNRLSPVQTPMFHQRFRQVAAGGYHTCAITDLDAVWCWGRNDSGQLGDGTFAQRSSPVAVAAFPAITETTIVVASFDDSNSEACTLRNALRAVDNRWSWYGCPPALGNVTIQIPAGVYTDTQGNYGMNALIIGVDVTIKGAGADKTTITVDPFTHDRALSVLASAHATISDLALRGGQSPTDTQKGGGIRNAGALTLTNVLITSNADGGLENTGELLMSNSAIVSNTGGGLINSGAAILVNSTLSGNTANTDGAETRNEGTLMMTHVTLNHTADSTASIYSSGLVVMGDSIINASGGCAVSGSILSTGHNLVNSAGCQAYFTEDGDLRGVDPRLGPIAQNAPGNTPTHALLPGSPAIDAGLFVGVTTDQRGVPRPQGEEVDIGAYEYRLMVDAPARVYLPVLAK